MYTELCMYECYMLHIWICNKIYVDGIGVK